MVRLVWFPGYVDWERRNYTWEIRGQTRTFAERGPFAQCVSLVILIRWSPGTHGEIRNATPICKLSKPRKQTQGERELPRPRQLNGKLSQPRKQRQGERKKLRPRQLNSKPPTACICILQATKNWSRGNEITSIPHAYVY